MKNRAAYSLVELMVVIALTGVVASIAAVCLHGLYSVDRAAREDSERRSSMVRLSIRFRSDTHFASEAAVSPGSDEGQAIVLTQSPDRSIEYCAESNKIERIVRQSQQIVHRDAFRLPGVREIRLETNTTTTRQAVIVIARKTPEGGDRLDGLQDRIAATIGLSLVASQQSEEKPRR